MASTGKRGLQLLVRLAQLGLKVGDAGGNLFEAALERGRASRAICARPSSRLDGTGTGHGFDTADVRTGRGLGNDLKQADLGGIGNVGAAAELAGERLVLFTYGHNANNVTVLLTKQRRAPEALASSIPITWVTTGLAAKI